MNPVRLAMSMIEMVISLALFSAVMVAVLQSMLSTTSYVEFDATRSDMQTETIMLQNRVINDLANTAWFYRFNFLEDRTWFHPVTKLRDPLYPKVSSDGSTIEFLKLRTSTQIKASPSEERYAFTNFRESTNQPVDFSQYVDAAPTPLLVMNPDYKADPQWFVAAVWEADEAGLTFHQNQDPAELRHYLYVVEADNTGTRNLVRKYLNTWVSPSPAPELWLLDEVLMRDVDTVAFATSEEDENLNENQIKISVRLKRKPQGSAMTGVVVDHQINLIASMRSINQEN